MTIQGVNGIGPGAAAGVMGMGQADDPLSKDLQRKIADVQKQMQELSAKDGYSAEEKAKMRQEFQKELNELNNQLRQHQIEMRREKQQEQAASKEASTQNNAADTAHKDSQKNGLSQVGMESMIAADVSIKNAKVLSGVATKMEDRAGVLKMEIKLDGSRGGDTKGKEAELADMEQKAADAAASALGTLADAGKAMEAAAKTEQTTEKSEDEAGKTGQAAKGAAKTGNIGETENEEEETVAQEEKHKNTESGQVVDVRL
ncbi:MAG: FlxA-like family protein [Muribaculaceae bacterium]|nr:FlxA-like family protein [Muribaculaceae bacterium]